MTPAVTFDRDAFRKWLRHRNEDGHTGLERLAVDGEYSDAVDDAAGMVETALYELRDTPEVLAFAHGVTAVDIWRTADSDGRDCGGLVVVTVDGFELSAGHLEAGDLVYGEPDDEGVLRVAGREAAEMALAAVAAAASRAVADHHARTGHGGQLTERALLIHGVTTEEQFRALEAHLGHSHGWMGRFKGGHSGIHLDHRDHDLDAAIAWALAQGLTVEQTRTTLLTP